MFRWRPWKALQDPRQENAPIGAPSHIAWLLHRNFPGFHRASRRVRRSSCSPRQILYHNPADFAADAEFFCAARSLADPQGLQALHLHIRRPQQNLTQEFSQFLAISFGVENMKPPPMHRVRCIGLPLRIQRRRRTARTGSVLFVASLEFQFPILSLDAIPNAFRATVLRPSLLRACATEG